MSHKLPDVPVQCSQCGKTFSKTGKVYNAWVKKGVKRHICSSGCRSQMLRDLQTHARPMVPHGMRYCTRCKTVRPLTQFYKNRNKEEGYSNPCQVCAAEYFVTHKEQINKRGATYQFKRRKELRLAALVEYGGTHPLCACCGETHQEFLMIDHINGGGNKHRKEIRATTFYLWLKKSQYPDGFRVLCANCNHARGVYGYCPHQQ